MKISEQGLRLLMEREGSRNVAYPDSKGIPTVGVGHTGPEVHLGLVWTDAQVAAALAKDLAWVDGSLALVKAPLEQHQYDALASFIFNIGSGQWAGSTMLRLINQGRSIGEVSAQFDRWHNPPEITSRRNGEREQFRGTAFEARIA